MCCAKAAEKGRDTISLSAQSIIDVFNRCFHADEYTVLRGGGDEPEYLPASGDAPATIIFRQDYASSALHEVAHWCIAGRSRRKLVDYGYWYSADGRSHAQQQQFLQVERKPQALEFLFSEAAGLGFHLSMDNLQAPPSSEERYAFARAVARAANVFLTEGPPRRAHRFLEALRKARGAKQTTTRVVVEDLL
ncbi:MAG: elongation factor P hydroxylase [Congregibacter sp.]